MMVWVIVWVKDRGTVNDLVARFTAKQAPPMAGLPQQTLSYWVRNHVLTPAYSDDSGWVGVHYLFSFQDLVTLRTLRVLREKDIPLGTIRKAADFLQTSYGRPWTSFRLYFYGKAVFFLDPQSS